MRLGIAYAIAAAIMAWIAVVEIMTVDLWIGSITIGASAYFILKSWQEIAAARAPATPVAFPLPATSTPDGAFGVGAVNPAKER